MDGSVQKQTGHRWLLLLAAGVAFQGVILFRGISRPWIDASDFNGAVWSQSAHNTLREGLWATRGVPSGFYYGSLPIPPKGYYTHHPPLLPLGLAGLFAVVGEHEWVARLVPVLASLASTVLVFSLVYVGLGARAGALAAAVFVALPMELHFGDMVNFEPITMPLMLVTLLILRKWEETREKAWRWPFVVASTLLFWTSWLGAAFLLMLGIEGAVTARHRKSRLLLLLALVSGVSLLLLLMQYSTARPDIVPEWWRSLRFRFDGPVRSGAAAGPATFRPSWAIWLPHVRQRAFNLIQPLAWCLAGLGTAVVLRRGRTQEPLRWLGRGALYFFGLNLIYVIAFRNASYIHDYALFYFVAPVAMLGGVGCDAVLGWARPYGLAARRATSVVMCGLVVGLAWGGARGAKKQEQHVHILGGSHREQPGLIPGLGALIRSKFAQGTIVITNCYPAFFPGLAYYAHRIVVGGVADGPAWSQRLAKERGPLGGVIWLGAPNARDLLHQLPPGTLETGAAGGESFVIWKPDTT